MVRNPSLPESESGLTPLVNGEDELAGVSRLGHRVDLLERDAATPGELVRRVVGARVFHFAGHGVADAGAGALLLAGEAARPNGLLSAEEIEGERWPDLELAVLASCESGSGEQRRIADPASLVRALIRAGAGRVVAASRKVPSEVTGKMLARFYEELAAGADAVGLIGWRP